MFWEKIQFEVDNPVNALFPEDQGKVRKLLKEKNRKLKKKLKKRREKKLRKFANRSNYGYYSRPNSPPHPHPKQKISERKETSKKRLLLSC